MDPSTRPDSILQAARKTAAALGLAWSSLDPVYRALQTPDDTDDAGTAWLPRSSGRQIFTAHPSHVTALLIGYGLRSAKVTPQEANYIACGLTPGGRPLSKLESLGVGGSPVAVLFRQLLTDTAAADAVDRLRFDAAERSITVLYGDGAPALHLIPATDSPRNEGLDPFRDRVWALLNRDDRDGRDRVGSITVIAGEALSEIARNVSWRPEGAAPVRSGQADE